MNTPYDLIIIGAGAAGMTAAIYAARRHLNFTVIATDIGGELANCGDVGNWPGMIATTGIELTKQFREHMESYDVPIEQGLTVTRISQHKNTHLVHAVTYSGTETTLHTKAVLIATGVHPRQLGIPGEVEKRGLGITYCTVCDGPLFRGKTTATIGAGNAAVESALMMAEIAETVYLLTKYPNTPEAKGGFPKADDVLVQKVKALANVEIIYQAKTQTIEGTQFVESLTYQDQITNKELSLAVQGVMIHVGIVPNSSFVDCVDHDALGQLMVDTHMRTSCPGIFAAGDVTTIPHKQIVIAAGHGATAALTAIEYVNRWEGV